MNSLKKTFGKSFAVLLAALTSGSLFAGNPIVSPKIVQDPSPLRWSAARPDGHAPMGVMGDHLHHANEWMVGYRFMFQHSEGLGRGTDSISNAEGLASGYTAVPLEMDMYMHMLDIMYAPTDWLTLMVMPQFVEMDMKMLGSHGEAHGHGATHHDDGGGHHDEPELSTHSHSTSGFGDTPVYAMFKLAEFNRQVLHAALGVSIPTGSVDEKMGGQFTHYGMQLGSGTWDLKPALTYLGQTDHFSWGAQISGTYRLEDENESGFRFGNILEGTTWGAWKFADWGSLSLRVAYKQEGDIKNHYNGPHGHASPPDLQRNYGGESINGGIGLNLRIPRGPLEGHRIGVELVLPLWQDLNGIQLEQDYAITAAWQYSF